MKLFLYLISIFWIIIGLTALINPLKLKTLYTNLVKPVKGLFILFCPINTLKSTFDYFINRSETFWRVYGLFVILLGGVIIFSIL